MKFLRAAILLLALLTAAAGLVLAYRAMRVERDLEATAEAPIVSESRVRLDDGGAAEIELNQEEQERLGLNVALSSPGTVPLEFTATAAVLDGAPLLTQLNEVRSREIALETARADSQRTQTLFEDGRNTSARAVEVAKALEEESELRLVNARNELAAAWGPLGRPSSNLVTLAHQFAERDAALMRVDLLPADASRPLAGRVRLLDANGTEFAIAELLGSAPSTDAPLAGRSWLALAPTNAPQLVPGARLLARVDGTGTVSGALLPREAIVRFRGAAWAYIETAPGRFRRRSVPLTQPHPRGWIVAGGWSDPVVIRGAQSLLSEELKAGIEMRD